MASVEQILEAVTSAAAIKDGLRRTRELYRYLSPASLSSTPMHHPQECCNTETPHGGFDQTPSLIPFVQLAALRCNTSKAFLNVIDSDTMYFLAQVSKRPHDCLSDTPMFESSEDASLVGCSTFSLNGRICDLKIRLQADEECRYPCLTIPDLSKDVRFSNLDIVAGGPKFRFYAGTPITTKDGINIGTIAVMDTQPRERLSPDEEQCLCETAAHGMDYLDLNRETIEGRQSRRMGSALNSFVAGESSLEEEVEIKGPMKQPSMRSLYAIEESVSVSHTPNQSKAPRRRATRKKRSSDDKEKCIAEKRQYTEERRSSASDKSDGAVSSPTNSIEEASETSQKQQEDAIQETEELNSRTHSKTFARAANLLREALELGSHGGVLFVGVTADTGIPTFLSDVKMSSIDESSSTGNDFCPEKVALAKLAEVIKSPTIMRHSNSVPASTLASSTMKMPLHEGHTPLRTVVSS
jgi:hypothetical protein